MDTIPYLDKTEKGTNEGIPHICSLLNILHRYYTNA